MTLQDLSKSLVLSCSELVGALFEESLPLIYRINWPHWHLKEAPVHGKVWDQQKWGRAGGSQFLKITSGLCPPIAFCLGRQEETGSSGPKYSFLVQIGTQSNSLERGRHSEKRLTELKRKLFFPREPTIRPNVSWKSIRLWRGATLHSTCCWFWIPALNNLFSDKSVNVKWLVLPMIVSTKWLPLWSTVSDGSI